MKHRFRAGLEILRLPVTDANGRYEKFFDTQWNITEYKWFRDQAVAERPHPNVMFHRSDYWYGPKMIIEVDKVILTLP